MTCLRAGNTKGGLSTAGPGAALQDYSIRAKMSEAVLAASVCRTSISEVYQSGGSAPDASAWGCESSTSKYVAGITTDANGVVTVTVRGISTSVDGRSITLAPYIDSEPADASTMMGRGVNEWRCGPAASDGVAVKYLPSSCRSA